MTDLPVHPEPAAVFIVGVNGSGTAMLRDSLGRHPQMYGFPGETRLLPYLAVARRRYGSLSDDENFRALWQFAASEVEAFRFANGGEPPEMPGNWREFPRNLGAILDAIYRTFAQRERKSRWCEKSPQNVQCLDVLDEVFPACRVIHVIRDGRACAASLHRRWGRTPELIVHRWRQLLEEARAKAPQLGERYLEIRYEDLTAEPEAPARRICEFLDLPFDDEVVRASTPRKHRYPTEIRARGDTYRSYFSAAKLRRMEAIAGEALASLDYPVDNPHGRRVPAALPLKWWRGSDFVRAYYRQRVQPVLRGESEASLGDLVRGVQGSVREYLVKRI